MAPKQNARKTLLAIESEINEIVLESNEQIHGTLLALLSNSNLLLLGKPGVAKSYVIRQLVRRLEHARYFEHLMGQYTTIENIAGPIDILALEKGKYVRRSDGYLPTAEIVFLDEIFKSNSGMINTLLKVFNEREFDDDGKSKKIPLLSLFAASNEMPEDGDGLSAAVDRFTLKYEVKAVREATNFLEVLRTKEREAEVAVTQLTIPDLLHAREEIAQVTVPRQLDDIILLLRANLEKAGVSPSPRAWANTLLLLKAEAWLQGRTAVNKGDLAILRHALWNDPAHMEIVHREVITLTIPEQQKALDEFERAQDLFDEFIQAKTREAEKLANLKSADDEQAANKVNSDIIAICQEYAAKLKTRNRELSTIQKAYMNSLEDQNENDTIARYQMKVKNMIKYILQVMEGNQ